MKMGVNQPYWSCQRTINYKVLVTPTLRDFSQKNGYQRDRESPYFVQNSCNIQ